jgi:hypothetical protein
MHKHEGGYTMFRDGLTPVIKLYGDIINRFYNQYRKSGRPFIYSQISFLLFFMAMVIKKIHKFKAMARYAKEHYPEYGFPNAPSRQTIRRRFMSLPELIQRLLPFSSEDLCDIDERFSMRTGFIDKCLFWAKGPRWHKKYMLQNIIPFKSIDREASWGYSPYHKWVFGYAVHLICNEFRFPLSASVTTAKVNESKQVPVLLKYLKELVLLIGDKGYRLLPLIKNTFETFKVFIISSKAFKGYINQFKKDYAFIISLDYAKRLYRKRISTIEPLFSLIKELFGLSRKKPLPYKSLAKNRAYLLTLVFTVQFMFVFNSINNKNLNSISFFKGQFL